MSELEHRHTINFVSTLHRCLFDLHRYTNSENIKEILTSYDLFDMNIAIIRYYNTMQEYGTYLRNENIYETMFSNKLEIIPGIYLMFLLGYASFITSENEAMKTPLSLPRTQVGVKVVKFGIWILALGFFIVSLKIHTDILRANHHIGVPGEPQP